jgi:hypothetical protein
MNLANVQAERFSGATNDDLQTMIAQIGASLPIAYLQLLQLSNGLQFDNGAAIYKSSQVLERNETNEVSRRAPTNVAIGDDGGGRLILIEKTPAATSRVLVVGSGSLGLLSPEIVGDTIEVWVEGGCPTRLKDDDDDFPEYVDVYLVAMPSGGAKSLISIKSELGMDMGLGELTKGIKELPFRVLERVPYGKYLKRSRKVNERFGRCVELRDIE